MAPISRTIAWAALAAIVSARPLIIARSQAPEMVTETDWVTIDVPVTLWVDEKGTPLSTVAQGGNFAAVPTSVSTSVAPVVTSASASASSAVPTVTSTTSLAPVAPVSPKAPVQAPSPSTSVVPTSTYVPTSSYVPTTTPAPVISYAPETTTTGGQLGRQETTAASSSVAAAASPAAAAGGDTGSISASDSNSCMGTGAACVGDITHYDGGLGACGWNVNTATDMQIALPYAFMGEQSNGNPYCGKSLTIKNPTTGQTVQATVGDKCMGCTGRSIDLTNALFNAIGNGCDGRCSGFQWWFN